MPRSEPALWKKRRDLWKSVLFRSDDQEDIVQQRLRLLETWRNDPWEFLAGHDLDGKPLIWTTDERDEQNPIKPFPAEKDYLKIVTREIWSHRFPFINKSRQMYMTTLCALNILWYILFHDEMEVFVSRVKEESAVKLINDKIRTPWQRLPIWVKRALPISLSPKNIITATETGSTVTAVAQNFGTSDARGPTGSLIMVDEAAYQDLFPDIYKAVLPMTGRLWALTTANVGTAGAMLFKTLWYEGNPGMIYREMEADESGESVPGQAGPEYAGAVETPGGDESVRQSTGVVLARPLEADLLDPGSVHEAGPQ
jgi:hypothetical protein